MAQRDQVGATLAETLANERNDITVVDSDADRLRELLGDAVACPGDASTVHNHWTFPICVENPTEVMEARLANARRVVIDDAGHCVNIERAEAFDREVLAFLGSLPAT